MQVVRLIPVLPLLLLAACSQTKSVNPLSPTLAGPIAGITITAPRAISPASGTRITRDAHPIRLTVENASTNGERPISYVYEVASDATFGNRLFHTTDVAPGADGRTSVELAGPLESGRIYYWRVQAVDGANSSSHSEVAHFTVFEPVVFSAPSPASPTGGGSVTFTQPTLRTTNASRSGPNEPVSYEFEVSLENDFDPLAVSVLATEQSGQTSVVLGALLPSRTYFWRVRAYSASATGPWSSTPTFQTTGAAPGGGGGGGGGGGIPPSNPGPRPSVSEGTAMVAAVIADLRARGISTSGDCGAFEITSRVAWNFRNRGAGLERKPGGRNCRGHSIDIVIFTDGQTVDMLIGAGGDNSPTWQEHGVLSDWADWWIAPSNPD